MLDTDVFSLLYLTPRESLIKQQRPVQAWEAALVGRRTLIAFQTRAEILAGVYIAKWGEKRLRPVMDRLDTTPTIDEDSEVVEVYARLGAESRTVGHPLGSLSEHVGDRWIAACAIAKDLPLLTGNLRHFSGAPRLELVELVD